FSSRCLVGYLNKRRPAEITVGVIQKENGDSVVPLASVLVWPETLPDSHGFNLETVEYRNLSFTVWDVGGQQRIRALWKYYFRDTQAIIFVVDSADVARMGEARNEIHSLIESAELHDAVLLVFANKQDMPNAMSVADVIKALDMHSIRNREWYVQMSNAITGEGLVEGLEWLHCMVVNK
ncbi:ADP ribosylation factor, partial [Trichostrongylus colubriformis]